MSTTIESLGLEIKTNSASAESGISALAGSLEKLKQATKGGLGLSSVAKQLTSVGTALNGINSTAVNNLSGLANAIKTLSGAKVSTSIAKNITSISNAVSVIDPSVADKLSIMTSALGKFSGLKVSSSISKNITKIATAVKDFDTDEFSKKISQMTEILEPFATQLDKVSSGLASFSKGAKNITASGNALTKSNTKSGSSFLGLGGKIGATYLAIIKFGKGIYNTIKKSSDYIEQVNLFSVSMGKYADEAKAYAETVSEVMGIDPGEWMYNQGVFQTLATGFGVASDKASIMSKNLTQLGYDISSFYNLKVEEAMEKLQSGLAGELEPLRRIGYDLSQAKLEETASELGIDKSVSSMTQAEKAMLRYHAIMTQVTVVQGDFSRTLDQPANQLRILKAQWEQLIRTVGNIFIPLLNKLLPYLIAGTKVLREMTSAIASLVGFEMPEVDYSGVETLASGSEDTASALDDATESAKKLKSYMLGFDELNVISPDNSSSGVDDSVGALDIDLPEYDFLGDATNKRVEGIVENIKELFAPIGELIDKTAEWAKKLDLAPMEKAFGNLGTSLKDLLTTIGNVFGWVYEDVLLPILEWSIENALPVSFEMIAESLELIDSTIQLVADGVKDIMPVLEPIITWFKDVLETVYNGFLDVTVTIKQAVEENGDEIKGLIHGIGDIIEAVWNIAKPIIDVIIPLLEKLFGVFKKNISDTFKNSIKLLGGIVDFVAGVLTGDWERAWDGISNIFKGIWDMIVSSFSNAWETIKAVAIAVWDALVGLFTPVANWFNEKVIQPVVDFFKGLWDKVSSFFSNLWDGIVGIWKGVATWFDEKVIQPIVNFFAPIVNTISQFFEGCWMIIQAVWVVASTWFDTYVIQPVVGFFKGLWEDISGFFAKLWDDITIVWNTVATWFDTNVVQPVVGFFEGVWTAVSGFFSSLWKDIKGVWKSVSTWFEDTVIKPVKTAFDKACEAIGGFFSNLWLGIRQGVANAMNGVIGAVESVLNGIITGINGLVGGFNKVVQWAADVLGKDWGGITLVQKVSFKRIAVPTYAEGGFPESGQAFIARENGIPEMVGSIGRRTAVANNEQIVESVASGVAEANSEQNALLREQNSLLRALLEKDSGVYLDGRSLSKSVDKYKQEHGRVLITGGVF